jgi:hypothetical protein
MLELHLELHGKQDRSCSWRCLHHRPELHMEVSTPRGLSTPGHVYTTEASGAFGRVYATGASAAPGLVWRTYACAAPGLIYTTEACAAL